MALKDIFLFFYCFLLSSKLVAVEPNSIFNVQQTLMIYGN